MRIPAGRLSSRLTTISMLILFLPVLTGQISCGRGERNQWIARLTQELKTDAENPARYVARGLAYLELEEYQAALEDFKQALEREGNNAYYHTLCARAYLGLKAYDAALARLVRARIFNVNLPDIYWVRGQVQQAMGAEEAAGASFDTAVAIDRKRIEPLLRRAEFYLQTQRYSEGLKDLDRVLSLDSNNAAAYNLRGRFHFVQGRFDSAFDNLHRAVLLDSTKPRYLSDEARAYLERRDKRSAGELYAQALRHSDYLPKQEVERIRGVLNQLSTQ